MVPHSCSNNTTKLKVCVLLFLLLACSTQQKFSAQGRLMARCMIGSRPPNCERKCPNCRRCDAIQVPTSAQETKPAMHPYWVSKARRDDSSNYKPISWKCKCGNHFFNP